MNDNTVIGIDFGTSNTLCCHINKTGDRSQKPVPVSFPWGGMSSFPTALLYRRGPEGQWQLDEFGLTAQQEWEATSPDEYGNLDFVANFKPDLAVSQDARRHAVVFLRKVAEHLFSPKILHGALLSPEQLVVFGVPATPVKDHTDFTLQVAKEAGFQNVETIEEPLAAFAFHLYSGDLKLQNANSGVLVVDFGGGTCDFAYVARGKCQHAWGNPLYGGRLFDDLFFQWLCDTNPGVLEACEQDGTEAYLHWHSCREAKEAFSKKMAKDRQAKYHSPHLLGKGALKGITWDQFCDRCRRFLPSDRFRKLLSQCGSAYADCFGSGPINLLDHFAASLRQGFDRHSLKRSDVEFVVLTGGSSLWPFVTDILVEEWGVAKEKIKQSSNPQETIGMGAALIPKLRREISIKKQELEDDAPAVTKRLLEIVSKGEKQLAKGLADDLASTYVVDHLEPLIARLKVADDNWSIDDLESQLNGQAEAFQIGVKPTIRERMEQFEMLLKADLASEVQAWLEEFQVVFDPRSTAAAAKQSIVGPMNQVDASEPIMKAISAVVVLITGFSTAAILGGGGIHLLMAGPIGWLIGLIIGFIVGAGIMIFGKDVAKQTVKAIEVPRLGRTLILRQIDLIKVREKVRESVRDHVRQEMKKHRSEIKDSLERLVCQIIRELDWVNSTMRMR